MGNHSLEVGVRALSARVETQDDVDAQVLGAIRGFIASLSRGEPLPHPDPLPQRADHSSHFRALGMHLSPAPAGERLGEGRRTRRLSSLSVSHTPPALREFRRELRRDSTDAERAIWWVVRNRHLGVKFRRQHSMGPYTLDFYCAELKLAVEIDGGQHYEDAGRRYDQSRDEALKAMGIRTLRFSNLDVLRETEGVGEAIWGEVQRLTESEREAPSPDLSPAGAGEREVPSEVEHSRWPA